MFFLFSPFKRQPQKMVKHTQRIHRLLPTNCLRVFDHFVRLALKGLTFYHVLLSGIDGNYDQDIFLFVSIKSKIVLTSGHGK